MEDVVNFASAYDNLSDGREIDAMASRVAFLTFGRT